MEFLEEQMIGRLHELPPEKWREVYDFVDYLYQRYASKKPFKSAMGILADTGLRFTKEEIDEARRELWGMSAKQEVTTES